jgi:hypothetical protein
VCFRVYACSENLTIYHSLLLIEFVAATAMGHNAENAIARKDKRSLPIPVGEPLVTCCPKSADTLLQFCCWRYRPTKVVIAPPPAFQIASPTFIALLYVYRQSECSETSLTYNPTHQLVACSSICHRPPTYVFPVILITICQIHFLVVSIAGIICEKYNVLCETAGFSPYFANVYLESIVFASIRLV